MNFHDTRQFPYVSKNAHKLLREVVREHTYRTSEGSVLEVVNADIFSKAATAEYMARRAAAAELPVAGYADVIYGRGDSFSVKLTAKGAELARYLAS